MTGLFTAPAPSTPTLGRSWRQPEGIDPRGTLLVLPGRGEHPLVYERFGRRLAADGYQVHALATTPGDRTEDVLARAAEAAGRDPVAPVILVGSDTGALQALHTAADADPRLTVAGIVVAGAAPTTDAATGAAPTTAAREAGAPQDAAGPWQAELAARTACPAHRKRLTEDVAFVRGSLDAAVPDRLRSEARPAVPALVLHGAADPVTPLGQARELAARLPRATLGVVRDGLHDVLNDASHRTTAAVVVLWLERLRADPTGRPILTVEEPAEPEAAEQVEEGAEGARS
ncbi:alpha/beta hydrolase [Streptomyces liangshanensis]|uniref:Alpha/beta hydrolase n=1 Tax=Streptomyces liangshanensis TaxID=2717324 RepID=A0A6G9GSX9_9ACTN|nr:alpha/beta hydrolase [Streptomyces liangshanensis]QIQ01047.1 alpha/beta hydrolase [Streptomyces liangshanensis]